MQQVQLGKDKKMRFDATLEGAEWCATLIQHKMQLYANNKTLNG